MRTDGQNPRLTLSCSARPVHRARSRVKHGGAAERAGALRQQPAADAAVMEVVSARQLAQPARLPVGRSRPERCPPTAAPAALGAVAGAAQPRRPRPRLPAAIRRGVDKAVQADRAGLDGRDRATVPQRQPADKSRRQPACVLQEDTDSKPGRRLRIQASGGGKKHKGSMPGSHQPAARPAPATVPRSPSSRPAAVAACVVQDANMEAFR
eukprot:SAG22_NODE_14_length_33165_cov_13.196698_29_plen_210_part_00